MTQQTISVVIPFQADPTRVQAELSASWGNPLRGHAKRALDELGLVHSLGVHAVGGRHSNHLVLELCVDGSPEHALAQVCAQLCAQLQRLLRSAGLPVPLHLYDYLRRHQPRLGLGWGDACGLSMPGCTLASVRRIRAEAELAARAKALIDELSALPLPALAKLCQLRESLWSDDGLKWAFEPQALLCQAAPSSLLQALAMSVWPLTRELLWPLMLPAALGATVGVVAGPWSALGLGGSVLVLELAWLVWLYKSAPTRAIDTAAPPAARAGVATPCSGQNHLMLVADLDRGWLGRLGLRVSLFAIRQMALQLFAPGHWAGALGAHASRWLVLERSSQLLFLAHHDADTDSFVEELARKSYLAQVAVWSNVAGFPRVKPVLAPATSDVAQVKAWALQHQQPTRAWYSGYPQLSVQAVQTHAAIRHGIATITEEASAARWLSMLAATAADSATNRAETVQSETIREPWVCAPENSQVSDTQTA